MPFQVCMGVTSMQDPPPDLVVWPGPCWGPGCYQPKGWCEHSLICPGAEAAGSWSRWCELIQMTFACSRSDCQQISRRGNLWLEGCAKHLQAVMASTSIATCWLNICLQLFIRGNTYIGTVMLHLLPGTGLVFPLLPFILPSLHSQLCYGKTTGSAQGGVV